MNTATYHLRLRIPAYTPPEEVPCLAGELNAWHPGLPDFRFARQPDGSWYLRAEADAEHFCFKITRGSWEQAEAGPDGLPAANRRLSASGQESEHWLCVRAWTDLQAPGRLHTISEHVVLLHPAFPAPQLHRSRRIWAYLPPGYDADTCRYPVLYMQDGQNLFDAYGSFSGEWAVDKALNRLLASEHNPVAACIVIGIENGGERRTAEYAPWIHPDHGGGSGQHYVDWICSSLKPWVDKALRTMPEREHTGIMGSSMGGLISLYAALSRPEVFGMAGVFSPSLWFSREIFTLAQQRGKTRWPSLLLMAGQQESTTMISDLLDLYEDLLDAGHPPERLHYDLHADGEHAEWFWAREFEHALRWLLGADAPHEPGSVHAQQLDFQLIPEEKQLALHLHEPFPDTRLEIRDYCHGRRFTHPLQAGRPNLISYREWEHCVYSIRIYAGSDLIFSRRVPVGSDALH